MTTMITRIYATPQQATDVCSALRRVYFAEYDVAVVGPTEGAGTVEALAMAVRKTGVHRADAPAYAQALAGGATLVTVHAPWGAAAKGIAVMDAHGPLPSPVRRTEYFRGFEDFPPMLSVALGWPLLSKEPFFFSNFFGTFGRMPLLWRSYRPRVTLMRSVGLFPGGKLLSASAMPSRLLGLPLLGGRRIFG